MHWHLSAPHFHTCLPHTPCHLHTSPHLVLLEQPVVRLDGLAALVQAVVQLRLELQAGLGVAGLACLGNLQRLKGSRGVRQAAFAGSVGGRFSCWQRMCVSAREAVGGVGVG